MFKFVVLSALVAIAVAKPGHLGLGYSAGISSYAAAPLAIPAAVSHSYRSDIISKPVISTYATSYAAPALTSYAAPALTSYAAPALTSYAAPAFSAYAAPAYSSYAAPAYSSYAAPAFSSYAAPSLAYGARAW